MPLERIDLLSVAVVELGMGRVVEEEEVEESVASFRRGWRSFGRICDSV